jgi:hypothetical protein
MRYFKDNGKYIRSALQPSYYFPRIRPILVDADGTEFIFEGGDGRYYHWNDICGKVWRIEESSLHDILAKLVRGLHALTTSRLRATDDPSGEPDSTVPCQPDPDFVDRPRISAKLRRVCMPQPGHAILVGDDGFG